LIEADRETMAAAAGYSGTLLHAKLGLKAGQSVLAVDAPENLDALLEGAPPDVVWLKRLAAVDLALLFVVTRAALAAQLDRMLPKFGDTSTIWVAWPKKASGVATDLTEDIVRDVALGAGFVDVKVCAIDATWSGLKLVRRLRDRGTRSALGRSN
jgi:hypothetical protein